MPRQPDQLLPGFDRLALAHQHLGHPRPGASSVDHRLVARHQEAGDANGRRKTGIGGAYTTTCATGAAGSAGRDQTAMVETRAIRRNRAAAVVDQRSPCCHC